MKRLIYETSVRDDVRLVLNYKGEYRAVLWFTVADDASLYMGPCIKNPTILKQGSVERTGGPLTIQYADGEPIDDAINASKLSFHGSGQINDGSSRRTFRTPLKNITKLDKLCDLLFMHPSKYDLATTLRAKDIVLDYPLDEDSPMVGQLRVAANYSERNLKLRTDVVVHQILACDYSELGLCLIWDLWNIRESPWPPYAYICWLASPPWPTAP